MPATTVKLIVSEENNLVLQYPARPCVVKDAVNLIPGETMYVEADVENGWLVNMKCVEKVTHPEKTIELSFTQNPDRSNAFMMLHITNPFETDLKYTAVIQYHDKEGLHPTSTLPVPAGLSAYESWPQPLTRIMLMNFWLDDGDYGQ